jgi:hypothetical protein
MNFIEAMTFYKHGKTIKRRNDFMSLRPSSFLIKKIKGRRLTDRDIDHLESSSVGLTEADILANDWVAEER